MLRPIHLEITLLATARVLSVDIIRFPRDIYRHRTAEWERTYPVVLIVDFRRRCRGYIYFLQIVATVDDILPIPCDGGRESYRLQVITASKGIISDFCYILRFLRWGLSQNSEVGLKLRVVAGRGGVLRASCYSAQNVAVNCALWQKSEGRK